MPARVELYDGAYANYGSDIYRQVRLETYGEDFGQTSWVTTEESREIPQLLDLKPDSSVLEVGCGSGGYALYLAEKMGCRLVGLDVNVAGVRNANELVAARGLAARVRFEECDASKNLPFDDRTFGAVFSNDVLCHLPGRPGVLCEICRIMKPGGRLRCRRTADGQKQKSWALPVLLIMSAAIASLATLMLLLDKSTPVQVQGESHSIPLSSRRRNPLDS